MLFHFPLTLVALLITLGGILLALGIDQSALYLLTKDSPKHDLVVHCCDEPNHRPHSHSCEDHSHGGGELDLDRDYGDHSYGFGRHGNDDHVSANDHGHDCTSHRCDIYYMYIHFYLN